MKKKWLMSWGFGCSILFSLTAGAWAGSNITLIVNGQISPAEVRIIEGSSYVPLRAVSELLGAEVQWNDETRTITVKKNSRTISLDEYEQIKEGMTYEQIQQVIGGVGQLVDETGGQGTETYTVMYAYQGEGTVGSNATFVFQGGQLAAKAEIGLE